MEEGVGECIECSSAVCLDDEHRWINSMLHVNLILAGVVVGEGNIGWIIIMFIEHLFNFYQIDGGSRNLCNKFKFTLILILNSLELVYQEENYPAHVTVNLTS